METTLKTGYIVKNLIPNEPVKIIDIQEAGEVLLIDYAGLHSRTSSNIALQKEGVQELQVVSQDGTFTLDGNPQHFKIFAEAERVHAAYQFDPLFAVNCSLVDPLPHQIEAVYKFLLPQPKIRFLLADDTGAGKTIMAGLLLNSQHKKNKMLSKLSKFDDLVDWIQVVSQIEVIDKTRSSKGGHPSKDLMWMIKSIFIQHLFNLPNPQLKDNSSTA